MKLRGVSQSEQSSDVTLSTFAILVRVFRILLVCNMDDESESQKRKTAPHKKGKWYLDRYVPGKMSVTGLKELYFYHCTARNDVN